MVSPALSRPVEPLELGDASRCEPSSRHCRPPSTSRLAARPTCSLAGRGHGVEGRSAHSHSAGWHLCQRIANGSWHLCTAPRKPLVVGGGKGVEVVVVVRTRTRNYLRQASPNRGKYLPSLRGWAATNGEKMSEHFTLAH